jgi:hypothetical protein
MSKQIRLTLARILEGKRGARPQTVGLMEVVPLLPQDETHHNRMFAVPSKSMLLAGNPRYGTIIVGNKDKLRPLIVPSNTTWITRHAAQDHALSKASLLAASGKSTYDTAACVEQTQAGQIPSDVHQFQILPASLRRIDKDLAEMRDFRKFWGNISTLNTALGLPECGGHLNRIFTHLDKELRQFVAEFETIPGQIGALIIINGKLQGVEIAPSPEYWDSVWEPLIRFSYGPEAVLAARHLGPDGAHQAMLNRPSLECDNPSSIEDIESALRKLRSEEKARVEEAVRSNLETVLDFEMDEQAIAVDGVGATVTYTLGSAYGQFIGQMVMDDDYVVYASMVCSEQVSRRSPREPFEMAGE